MTLLIKISLFMCLCALRAIADSKLVFSFMVHRHGDRTPNGKHVKYSTNPEQFDKLIQPYGYRQLTEIGMQRAYRLGEYIRSRYDSILDSKYNETKVYLRSTDMSRSKMTMLAALAAVYPPVDNWNEDLNWTPVPYTTLPVELDYNLPSRSCPKYKDLLDKIYEEKFKEMEPYNDVLELVSNETGVGFDVRDKPLVICDIHNVFESQVSLGLNLTSRIQDALPKIKEAANTAFDIMFKTHDQLIMLFTSGVLLSEFIDAANSVVNGDETEIMRIYSSHHWNVYSFSKIAKTDIFGMPPFASVFSLDLRREIGTDKFYVEPVFAHDVNDGGFVFKTLEVEGCGNPCYYSEFLDLIQDFAWDFHLWTKKCGLNGKRHDKQV